MAHALKSYFVFQRKGRVHLSRWGASVQSTTGSRSVRISGTNAGYTMFRGSVKGTGYPLHSHVSPSLPLPCVTVCHQISTERNNTAQKSEVREILAIINTKSWYDRRLYVRKWTAPTIHLFCPKGKGQALPVHGMKTYDWNEMHIYLFLTVTLDQFKRSASWPGSAKPGQ